MNTTLNQNLLSIFQRYLHSILTTPKTIPNLFRSLFVGRRPIFVNAFTRWFWYGDEDYCKCCGYSALFTSLENANLLLFEYAAASGCRRCRILLHGINHFSAARWQERDKASVLPQLWDSSAVGVEVLVSYPDVDVAASRDPKGALALEFFFHRGGHPLYPWMEPRPRIEARSDTSALFDLIRAWMDKCASNHTLCNISQSYVPTRLVDVKKFCLVTQPTQDTRYIALSHCWGSKQDRGVPMPKTTKLTLNARQHTHGIAWAELTKSIQDALFITRSLGFAHIWIDSLCIIQDDPQDWATQASLMSSVYGGAALVISAARAATGDAGIFHARPPPFEVEGVTVQPRIQHDMFVDPNASASAFGANPVFSRGWCFQERLLAHKVVHYTADELVWECNEDLWCECGSVKTLSAQNFKMRLGAVFQREEDVDARFAVWAEVVRAYTSRKLTFETDRLPALAGIARRFQSASSGRYLAGVWESDLPEALLWVETPVKAGNRLYVQRCALAPSWSWLSMTQCMIQPHFRGQHLYRPMAVVKEVQCHTTTANPYGEISHGHIVLSAPLVEVILQKVEFKPVGGPK